MWYVDYDNKYINKIIVYIVDKTIEKSYNAKLKSSNSSNPDKYQETVRSSLQNACRYRIKFQFRSLKCCTVWKSYGNDILEETFSQGSAPHVFRFLGLYLKNWNQNPVRYTKVIWKLYLNQSNNQNTLQGNSQQKLI